MTSKQRAYLKGLAMTMDPILQLGKGGLTPENTFRTVWRIRVKWHRFLQREQDLR